MDLIRKEQKREMGELMKGFVDQTLDFYEGMKDRDVSREADEAAVKRLRSRGIPAQGRPVKEVFEEMERDVYANQSWYSTPGALPAFPAPSPCFLGWETL